MVTNDAFIRVANTDMLLINSKYSAMVNIADNILPITKVGDIMSGCLDLQRFYSGKNFHQHTKRKEKGVLSIRFQFK